MLAVSTFTGVCTDTHPTADAAPRPCAVLPAADSSSFCANKPHDVTYFVNSYFCSPVSDSTRQDTNSISEWYEGHV